MNFTCPSTLKETRVASFFEVAYGIDRHQSETAAMGTLSMDGWGSRRGGETEADIGGLAGGISGR